MADPLPEVFTANEAETMAEVGHGGAEVHVEPSLFGMAPFQIVALAMLILVLIMLWKRVPGMITGGIDGKIAAIRQQLDEAKALRAEAEQLRAEYRTNTYDPATKTITVSPARGHAIDTLVHYYAQLFYEGRTAYALPAHTIENPARAKALSAFFFWSAWAAATERPGDDITYTSNWPHEPLINNEPTPDTIVWTGVLTTVIALAIKYTIGWRIDEEAEVEGIDFDQHGETAYDLHISTSSAASTGVLAASTVAVPKTEGANA